MQWRRVVFFTLTGVFISTSWLPVMPPCLITMLQGAARSGCSQGGTSFFFWVMTLPYLVSGMSNVSPNVLGVSRAIFAKVETIDQDIDTLVAAIDAGTAAQA